MDNSNAKKDKQLGMSHGKASNILRKKILFSLIQRLEEDTCYRCEEKIKTADELSIEHKIPWLDSENPVALYFDLDNISFSHLSCNCSSSRPGIREKREKKETHGLTGYSNGCRCDTCIFANRKRSEYQKEYRKSPEFRKWNKEYQKRRYDSEPEFKEKSIQRRIEYRKNTGR